jgi:glycosyltransferase involved in cell wall biosynthesis
METWPRYIAPMPVVERLKRYELSLPARYGVDGVLTVSDALADLFAESRFPREKICPIYYGYDAKYFPFRNQPSPKQPPIIVMHGSFDAHHLGEIAFQAAKFVSQQKPGTVFRFIGKRTAPLEKLLNRAQQQIPGFKFDLPGFVPYPEVSKYLEDASVGIVPYEESVGTHCAFVAKVVEYVAVGLPAVSTPLKSIRNYFKDDPMVKFSGFNGEDFGRKIISTLDESPKTWQLSAAKSAARVQAELDWQPLCHRAIDFAEKICRNAGRRE